MLEESVMGNLSVLMPNEDEQHWDEYDGSFDEMEDFRRRLGISGAPVLKPNALKICQPGDLFFTGGDMTIQLPAIRILATRHPTIRAGKRRATRYPKIRAGKRQCWFAHRGR